MNGLWTFWAEHAPMWAVLCPAFTAMALLLIKSPQGSAEAGGGHAGLRLRRAISMASLTLGLVMAAGMVHLASSDELLVYRVGDWPAPFGIVLVLDRLSALMLLLTYLVALPVMWYACGGWDTRGRLFHALFQFQLMGLCGAFMTGDLFNLFVFFEVLLIASYVLLLHGQGTERFRVGVHYVVLNLSASALFLIALAVLYGVTGTLNMADMALRVASLSGESAAMASSAALLLLVVFGLKAAVVPLSFWLPATYAAASAPVAALFAIMTKVGVYSIIRVHWGIFGASAGESAGVAFDWLLPVGLVTAALGVLGALAAHGLGRLVAYLTVSSVGTMLAAVALGTPATLSAALYYMLHSTLVVAGLFLLVELIAAQRGATGDRLRPAPSVREPVLLGVMLILGAASAAGLPPLPGFLGKVMILQGAAATPPQAWVWTVVLMVGFFTLIGLARAGVVVFWHVQPDDSSATSVGAGGGASAGANGGLGAGSSPRMVASAGLFLAMSVLLSVAAAPVKRYTDATAAQWADQARYASAVLGLAPGQPSSTTRPYDGKRPPVHPATPASNPAEPVQ